VADEHQQPGTTRTETSNVKRWTIIVLLILLAIFVLQNSQEVKIDFLFFTSTTTPLIIALVLSAAIGALIGWLAPRARRGRD
jgi:uncharacterized integral membrane protein